MTDGGSATGVAAAAGPPRGLSYNQVRILMLVAGLVLLAVTAGVNYVRRVETAEVAAILFFIPIVVALPVAAFDEQGWRRRRNTLRQLGRLLADSVRTVDRAVHARDADRHRIVVVLPETAAEGAQIFTDRLATRITAFLAQRGATVSESAVSRLAITFPGDEAPLDRLRQEFAEIERREHPEHPEEPLVNGVAGAERRRT